MFSYKVVKEKAKRNNQVLNDKLHPFASKFSLFFSWIFINLNFTPNNVTFLFFIVGFFGSFFFLSNNIFLIIIGYFFWRLHIIFDICDGEVARFTKVFSMNGAYWDYMIHAVLYPLYFINICVSQFFKYDNHLFLFLAITGSFIISLQLAVKNNYFRAILSDGKSLSEYENKSRSSTKNITRHTIYVYITELLGFEGFLFLFILMNFICNEVLILLFIIVYSFLFFLAGFIKFFFLSKNGFYPKRS
ncbi:hypothetical protein OAQ87_00950 [Candidatus Marinimicrobia bacterium]|nr:hypothetical protein [Candidatus Neomarinimicrobiota bacterium]